MPEGVEVCISSQYLHRKLKTKKLVSMSIRSGKFKRNGVDGSELVDQGSYRFKKVDSKGKFLWFELEDDKKKPLYIMSGFGLVGFWGFHEQKHSHVEFVVEDGQGKKYSLYFTDHRNFGTMKLTDDPNVLHDKLNSLGPDLLKESFTAEEFEGRIQRLLKKHRNYQKKKIVKILMDQTTNGLGCGIGNYLVAEIMYRARLSPHTPLSVLGKSKEKRDALMEAIKYTFKWSYNTNTSGYMVHLGDFVAKHKKLLQSGEVPDFHPETKVTKEPYRFLVYQQKEDPEGNEVVKETIVNKRTTFWVKELQK